MKKTPLYEYAIIYLPSPVRKKIFLLLSIFAIKKYCKNQPVHVSFYCELVLSNA
jgi:hypothetical protein